MVVTTVLHQWMGGFPQDEAQAFGVISWGSAAAALSHATKVIVKTPHEAMGVPTAEANAQGLRCTKQVISMLCDQYVDENSLKEEKEIIIAETKCLLDKCFELGNGDIALGTVRAFQAGVLDIPFAPSRYNAGQMLPVRDNNGAVRILTMVICPSQKNWSTLTTAKSMSGLNLKTVRLPSRWLLTMFTLSAKADWSADPETNCKRSVNYENYQSYLLQRQNRFLL